MIPAVAMMEKSWNDQARPAIRRGECPTLGKPMMTGDGLLARLRPKDSTLDLDQMLAVAKAADEFGNGLIEITARGSLQIRGVRTETIVPLEKAIFAAAIEPSQGIAIEVGPLSGIDPDELVDTRPMAAGLRAAIDSHHPKLELAAKLSITLDGGGRFHLGDIASDIKVAAFRESGGQIRFMLAVGGDSRTARRVAILEEWQLVPAVMRLLELLAAHGPFMRGKELETGEVEDLFPLHADVARIQLADRAAMPAGIHDFGYAGKALGLALPYGQSNAQQLAALVDQLTELGAGEIRLAPNHALFVLGLPDENLDRAERAAAGLGFWTDPAEKRQAIALCAGARGCASAFYDTRSLAEAVMARGEALLDGSFFLHLSGCAKGCAHPARSILALVGTPTGYGLVVNGAASAPPVQYIAASELDSALEGLASLIKRSKEAGETVRDCLNRLGASRIAAALTLDRT